MCDTITYLQLQSDEFLNVDSILEEVLHALVIKPLQPHLNTLFSKDFERSGCLQMLKDNMFRAKEQDQGWREVFEGDEDAARRKEIRVLITNSSLIYSLTDTISLL
jgi:hypothetical protein